MENGPFAVTSKFNLQRDIDLSRHHYLPRARSSSYIFMFSYTDNLPFNFVDLDNLNYVANWQLLPKWRDGRYEVGRRSVVVNIRGPICLPVPISWSVDDELWREGERWWMATGGGGGDADCQSRTK